MLLIGSRAIRYHLPEFRQPKDWDLIGTLAEKERIDSLLKPADKEPTDRKQFYRYEDAYVEFIIREKSPYWDMIAETFRDAPVLEDPVLGELHVPSLAFLLMTKQCSLIYPIVHWHKNLEDVFWLRSRVHDVAEDERHLLAATQRDSAEVYRDRHARTAALPVACHPKLPPHPDAQLHALLHERMKLEQTPLVRVEGAWLAFPDSPPEERKSRMIQLLAEEAMVHAGHRALEFDANQALPLASEMKRKALRSVIWSHLPAAWRYFAVNHYDSISALIPENLYDRIEDLQHLRPNLTGLCLSDTDTPHNRGRPAPAEK